jgi:hypothetical protein
LLFRLSRVTTRQRMSQLLRGNTMEAAVVPPCWRGCLQVGHSWVWRLPTHWRQRVCPHGSTRGRCAPVSSNCSQQISQSKSSLSIFIIRVIFPFALLNRICSNPNIICHHRVEI